MLVVAVDILSVYGLVVADVVLDAGLVLPPLFAAGGTGPRWTGRSLRSSLDRSARSSVDRPLRLTFDARRTIDATVAPAATGLLQGNEGTRHSSLCSDTLL